MRTKKIYPAVDVRMEEIDSMHNPFAKCIKHKITTYVRFKHEKKKWYLMKVFMEAVTSPEANPAERIADIFSFLNRSVMEIQYFGRPNDERDYETGEYLCTLDENQEDDDDRIQRINNSDFFQRNWLIPNKANTNLKRKRGKLTCRGLY